MTSEISIWETDLRSFSDYNPAALFLYYLFVLIPVMFCVNPALAGIGLLSGILYFAVRAEFRNLGKGAWMLLMPVLGAILNPLFNHNGVTVLFVMNDNPVTLEALLYGLCAGMMIGAVLFWFSTFTQIMTSDKLLYVFGSISPKLALILSMVLRYIPLFRRQVEKTNQAQKAMGLYREDGIIDKVRGGMRVFSVMVSWALENGVITADSMTARGYGIGKRSFFAIFRWTSRDTALLAVSACLSAFCCAMVVVGRVTYVWFPAVQAPESGGIAAAVYFCYAVLSLIPEYLQGREAWRWNSLQSKI